MESEKNREKEDRKRQRLQAEEVETHRINAGIDLYRAFSNTKTLLRRMKKLKGFNEQKLFDVDQAEKDIRWAVEVEGCDSVWLAIRHPILFWRLHSLTSDATPEGSLENLGIRQPSRLRKRVK